MDRDRHTLRGKWSEPGVPKKGWTCVAVEDLEEPTNHLDIEGRDALVEALTKYTGAIILVSHDMHLLGLVADRLWLVQGGSVTPHEEDLDAYRDQMLHASNAPVERPKAATPTRFSRGEITALRVEVRKCESRLAKLNEMRDQLAVKLSDPALYDAENGDTSRNLAKEICRGYGRYRAG